VFGMRLIDHARASGDVAHATPPTRVIAPWEMSRMRFESDKPAPVCANSALLFRIRGYRAAMYRWHSTCLLMRGAINPASSVTDFQ